MTITRYDINSQHYYAYSSVGEGDKYYSLITNDWNDITETDRKKILLINATRRIDLLRFKSTPVKEYKPKLVQATSSQPLKFPRVGYDLPYDIELATIILAGSIHGDVTGQFISSVNTNLKRIKAGPIDIEFYETVDIELAEAELSIIDPTLRALLAPYIISDNISTGASTDEVLGGGCSFGTDEESSFADRNKYHRWVTY